MNGPDEFWSHVDQSGGPDSCWPWMLSTTVKRRNYGQVNWQGRMSRSHRVAYELTHGVTLNADEPLDHTCHDPNICTEPCPHTRCCNPKHLELVTQAENNARRARDVCKRGHPKTSEYGKPRGTKWRCTACEVEAQRERRKSRKKV